jgi:hypothetical protein
MRVKLIDSCVLWRCFQLYTLYRVEFNGKFIMSGVDLEGCGSSEKSHYPISWFLMVESGMKLMNY